MKFIVRHQSLLLQTTILTMKLDNDSNHSNRILPVVDDRTGDDGNELLDDFLFNAGLVLIGFTISTYDTMTQ